jgi:hypothetical protein
MREVLEPRNKRERKKWNYFRAASSGRIPWTARGIEECVRHLAKTFADLPTEERKDWCPYIASLHFIKEKYGENRGTVHFLRMGQIINFMIQRRKRLIQDGLIVTDENGTQWWTDHLAEAFARLPYTFKNFKYEDVKRYVKNCEKPS